MTEGAALLEDVEILGRRAFGALPLGEHFLPDTRRLGLRLGLWLFKAQNAFSLLVFSGVWLVEWGTGNSTFAPSRAESPETVKA